MTKENLMPKVLPLAKCAIVDWGTSSFRRWVLDQFESAISELCNKSGMTTLTRSQFLWVFEAHLAELGVNRDRRLCWRT